MFKGVIKDEDLSFFPAPVREKQETLDFLPVNAWKGNIFWPSFYSRRRRWVDDRTIPSWALLLLEVACSFCIILLEEKENFTTLQGLLWDEVYDKFSVMLSEIF